MSVFIHGTVEAGFDVLKAMIESDIAGPAGEFVDEYRLAHLGNGGIMFCAKVNDFEKMGTFMSDLAEVQWDKHHGCVYKVYSVEEMQG